MQVAHWNEAATSRRQQATLRERKFALARNLRRVVGSSLELLSVQSSTLNVLLLLACLLPFSACSLTVLHCARQFNGKQTQGATRSATQAGGCSASGEPSERSLSSGSERKPMEEHRREQLKSMRNSGVKFGAFLRRAAAAAKALH